MSQQVSLSASRTEIFFSTTLSSVSHETHTPYLTINLEIASQPKVGCVSVSDKNGNFSASQMSPDFLTRNLERFAEIINGGDEEQLYLDIIGRTGEIR